MIVYDLNDIFPGYKKFLSGEYGYISLFTTNNAVRMLTSLYSNKKGITLEHAFWYKSLLCSKIKL